MINKRIETLKETTSFVQNAIGKGLFTALEVIEAKREDNPESNEYEVSTHQSHDKSAIDMDYQLYGKSNPALLAFIGIEHSGVMNDLEYIANF